MTSSQEILPVPDADAADSTSDLERCQGATRSEVPDVEKCDKGATAKTSATADETQRYIVSWEEPEDQDKANPMNWPSSKKWRIIALLSFTTFLT